MLKIIHISTAQTLIECCQQWVQSEWIVIDTEFIREKTYFPKLGLIQINNGELAATIDPLNLDLTPLKKLFFNTKIIKVLHSGRQDLALFYHLWKQLPCNLFDTQICATLLGYPDQSGYAKCVKNELNIQLDKSYTRSNWLKRPLSQEMLKYALEDVIYLAPLYLAFREKLIQRQQQDWLLDDFNALSQVDLYQVNTQTIWKKIKGRQNLTSRQLALLQRLAQWREEKALKKDLPRQWIVPNQTLLTLCEQYYHHPLPDLAQYAKYQDEWNVLSQKVQNQSDDDLPKEKSYIKPTITERKKLQQLTPLIKKIEQKMGLKTGVLASKANLIQFIQGKKQLPFLIGWRKKCLEQEWEKISQIII